MRSFPLSIYSGIGGYIPNNQPSIPAELAPASLLDKILFINLVTLQDVIICFAKTFVQEIHSRLHPPFTKSQGKKSYMRNYGYEQHGYDNDHLSRSVCHFTAE
jgi:hypothetical protein